MATKEMTGSPASKPGKRSSVKSWGEWIAGWLPAVGGSILFLIAIFRPREKSWGEHALGFLSCIAVSVIVHELAHFFAAKCLGLKPWCLRIHNWWEVLVTLQFVASVFVLRHLIY